MFASWLRRMQSVLHNPSILSAFLVQRVHFFLKKLQLQAKMRKLLLLRDLSQLLHDRMRPKCRASEEVRNLFYECSHEKDARTKALTF